MGQLRDKDRDAIVLRFFENKSLREGGTAMGLEERAAQLAYHPSDLEEPEPEDQYARLDLYRPVDFRC